MDLQDRAMLVSLNISRWTARKMDKDASDATADLYKAEHSEVSTYKSMVQKKHLDEIKKIVGKARTMHYKFTSPYIPSKGQAILATKMLPEYMAEGSRLTQEFTTAVNKFLSIYRDAQEEARKSLQNMYNPADYPSEEQLRRKFNMAYDFAPLPKGEHLKIAIGEEELAEMQADIEEKVKDSMKMAMEDLWKRVYNVVGALKERLTPDKGKDKKFHDSLIGNIAELASILPKMNIGDDPDLNAMADKLAKDFANIDPETLRIDRELRKDAMKKADEILKKVSNRVSHKQVNETPVAPVQVEIPIEPVIEPVSEPVAEPVAAPEPVKEVAPAKVEEDEITANLRKMGII